jgi:hypothetical protein
VLGSEPAKDAEPLLQSGAAFAGGSGTRAQIFAAEGSQWYFGGAEHAPFRDEFQALIVATIGQDFRAKRCALTLDEPLQMMSPEDSFYKDFATVKAACRLSNLTYFRSRSRD